MLSFILLVVLASSISGDLAISTYQDSGRARTVLNRFARDDKELGPQLGKHLPGERSSETAET
jgi:hypothetical protein